MEGDGMSAADKIKEADWRLFRSRLPIWQEAYMERLNREYIALLSGTGSASEKFWELERRMREDKRRGSVVMRMSRSNMELNLLSLLSDGVISTAELDGFSEELREKLGCEAVIHMDPIVTDDGITEETRQRVAALVRCIDDEITIHDFRMVAGPTHTNVIFDAVVPFHFRLTDAEVREKIETAVRTLDGNYYAVVNVERPYT